MDTKNSYFSKEIYRLRLAITTNCILRCRYCFVYKNNKVIPYSTAIKAINLFLNSKGKEKILMIYGGEPLLYFNLLKKIINFARNKEKELKKSLTISLGTNCILLNQNQLDFFKKTNVKLAISIDGQKKFHDKARIFENQKGSFEHVLNKIPLILKSTEKENFCALFGILPSSAYKMYDNLIYLTKLGFDSINIEPIESHKFKWNQQQQKIFKINLVKFIKYLYRNIQHGNFVFINSVNREIKSKKLTSKKNICPFFKNLEIYPEGEMIFSPLLINSRNKNKYIIGNIKTNLLKRYAYCNFHPNTKNCRDCWQNYLNGEDHNYHNDSEKALKWRNDYSIDLSKKISALAEKQLIFKKYIQEAKKRVFE